MEDRTKDYDLTEIQEGEDGKDLYSFQSEAIAKISEKLRTTG